MIQVRCNECGYLQTLSEERFLSIAEEYLTCPHCSAKVPKTWTPADDENLPDEARHKILAFSRRILNGRNVSREVVYALESLVRHYGAMDETDKALGLGYASLGEHRKAEEFLVRASQSEPGSPEVLQRLLEAYVAEEKYPEAVDIGHAFMNSCREHVRAEDVGRHALALIRIGAIDEAKAVLDSRPDLDQRDPFVKQARKELSRGSAGGLRRLFRDKNPIHRFLGTAGMEQLKSLKQRAGTFMGAESRGTGVAGAPGTGATSSKHSAARENMPLSLGDQPAFLEYWVYCRHTDIPRWEDIREALTTQLSQEEEYEFTFAFLETHIETESLAIEYILKHDAPELFDYPEDVIEHNSRGFEDEDRRTLADAEMIVRLRLSLPEVSDLDYLIFMERFVEGVRALTGGVVQDAVSHTLWGAAEYKRVAEDDEKRLIPCHLQLEALDEGGAVWIHTHGMQKFGLPDIEIEGIPSELVPHARKMIITVAEMLVTIRHRHLRLDSPLKIPYAPIEVVVDVRPQDGEGHFPAGSFGLLPQVEKQDSNDPDALKDALKVLGLRLRPDAALQERSRPESQQSPAEADNGSDFEEARQRLLSAHRRAREDLPGFRRSFQESQDAGNDVHAVKVGFPAQGGTYEWMWVSLEAWREGTMVGHLENAPVLRKDLERGCKVQISENEIFDWVITRGGDVWQGAYTEGIIS